MSSCIILICLCLMVLYLFTSRRSKAIYLRRLVFPVTLTLFILFLIAFSDTAVNSARNGLNLWFNIVLPSLFPFFVASELLNASGFIRAAGILLEPVMRPLFNVPGCGSFALAMGITSGYPVGARITAGMREEKLLSRKEAERLLAFTNNSGPLFIVGAVAVGMFKEPGLGVFLLFCHILACITVGILFGIHSRKGGPKVSAPTAGLLERFRRELLSVQRNIGLNIGSVLGDAVRNSLMTMLSIGGFIILFSVIIHLLLRIGFINNVSDIVVFLLSPFGVDKEIISAVISGIFEITTGASMSADASGAPLAVRLAGASMIIGWAGFSVHSQVLSIISRTDISIKPYLLGKFLQGVISAFYTYLGIKIAGLLSIDYKPAFNNLNAAQSFYWEDYLLFSLKSLLVSFIIIMICISISLIKSAGNRRST